MKIFFTLSFLFFCLAAYTQVVADFENFQLQRGEYINNASPADGFQSGSVYLPNDYNHDFGVWSGFSISADTNTTTPGFLNQYSSIAGEGALGTQNYAVGYIFDPEFIYPVGKAAGKPIIGLYVTNTTYAYLSMLDGDAFAKKFGGETGDDPDFFMLTIKKYSGGAISDDSINFYLADYRSPDPGKDYIISEWKYIDLSGLGEVDSLVLRLTSSDVGIFGMNTPAYVCFDHIITDDLLSAASPEKPDQGMTFSPNPASGSIDIYVPAEGRLSIISLEGRTMWAADLPEGDHRIPLDGFASGLYLITLNGHIEGKFTKE
jgi:hypothetical protein